MKFLAWARSLWRALRNAGGFFKAVPEWREAPLEVALSRLRTCGDCDRLDIMTRQCTVCGCFVSLKVRDGNQSCPVGKWGKA